MDTEHWSAVMLRIGAQDADDIDDILAELDLRHAPGGVDVFPEIDATLMPASEMKRLDAVAVGIRVHAPLPDAADRAMRLAAFALERDVDIVILADTELSGMERFGFRTERVAGESVAARTACEEQIRRFWNIDLVL